MRHFPVSSVYIAQRSASFLVWSVFVCFSTMLALEGMEARAESKRLKGSDIAVLLNDATAFEADKPYRPWRQVFYADGQTVYYSGQGPGEPGLWEIRADQYCSVWPPSKAWVCYDVVLESVEDGQPKLTWIAPSGLRDAAYIFPGDHSHLRKPPDIPQ